MTYFFDNNLSIKIVQILKILDVDAIHLTEQYAPGTLDMEWIPGVGKKGYVIITLDGRIATRPPERKVLRQARVTSVFIYGKFPGKRIWEQVMWILKHWDKIECAVASADRGTILRIDGRGTIKRSLA